MSHGYPRPQLRRANALNLNGPWLFAIDADAKWRAPEDVRWGSQINVPFAPETPASGIGDTGYYRAVWYRRAVEMTKPALGERVILHFGAVDHHATVWVNGQLAVTHEGGYTPFSADITDLLHPRGHPHSGLQTIVVRAEDDPLDMSKPRGKQDWQLEPHDIWYPRTTGIWQTVWFERVPVSRIAGIQWSSDVPTFSVTLDARIEGMAREGLRLRVRLARSDDGSPVADDTYSVTNMRAYRRIHLPDPGIDAERARWLWRPGNPVLFDALVQLQDERGHVLDAVQSYTALRSVGVDGDRFLLNGRAQRPRMVLDQGYWPETGMSPPDDAAIKRDIELTKALGFNGARKHQKIEDPRYLYWADRLGLLVWEEMPAAYAFDTTAQRRLASEWTAAIERDRSHPSIVAWVPFNESWGLPDLPASSAQRAYAGATYALTHALDGSRPVITNDGWENLTTDILTIHDYDQDADTLGRRLGDRGSLARHIEHGRAAGRRVSLANHRLDDAPVMLTEFGGVAYAPDPAEGSWGYSRARTPEDLLDRYRRLMAAVRNIPHLSGFCYTQLTDTYQETNGLVYADRTPKTNIDDIARATRGR